MDKGKVISLSPKRQIHPDDPLLDLRSMLEEILKEADARRQKQMADELDQMSALHAQAEAAAAKRGEKLLIDGAAFMDKQLQAAAAEAAADFVAATRNGLADMMKQANRTIMATWICAATAGCAAIGAVAILWL